MTKMISSEIPDWSREKLSICEWSPGKRLISSIRSYQKYKQKGLWAKPIVKFAVLRHRVWSAISGADIPLNCNISGGLLIPHPNGIVIHPDAYIGPNCLIMQQVTLGVRGDDGLPRLVGHVDVGAGAKILGGVTIGEHTEIGANAVVISNVPPHHIAVGIPARVIPKGLR